ncbi:MAG TPA: TatD family hydrolase [Actinomycetota bacterium]
MIDTHCHLFLMEGEPKELVREAEEAGVGTLVCVGVDRESSHRSRELADSIRGVFATAGVHPHDAKDFDDATGVEIEELLSDPRVVAVGETGLDHYRMLSPAEDQDRVFRAHCSLAREHDKPVVVHSRDAWPDVLRILEEERLERVILHCFSGGEEEAREAARRGYHCSFAGPITYPKNERLRAAAAVVPEELLLVETDSPYLPPQPLRGRPNAPGNLRLTLQAVAEVRGQGLEELEEITDRNARAAFALPG